MPFAEKIWNNVRLRYQTLTGQLVALPPPPRTVTASTTITDADGVILADATGGAVVVTLLVPTTATIGQPWTVKKTDAGANTVTVSGTTIDGGASIVLLTQNSAITFAHNGTSYYVIAKV
jgi:hypothetical protein